MRRLSLVLFVTLLIAGVAFIVGTIGQLPPRVASHFGAAGRLNAWMSRDGYALFILGFGTLFPMFIVASLAWLPHVMSRGVSCRIAITGSRPLDAARRWPLSKRSAAGSDAC